MRYLEAVQCKIKELKNKDRIRILAIETSCDESAAAVIENGRKIISSCVYSQIDLHALYGGVVPEIASRSHIQKTDLMVEEAVRNSGMRFADLDAVAVTYGPGLVGSLLTGVSCAKALAYMLDLPLIPVNHIEGHICSNYLTWPELEPPFLCLVVSGGHSHILSVDDYGKYTLIGRTQDDAAGEAFDKAARVLDLPYPGGPRLDELAETGDPHAIQLPKPHTDGKYDFSFSGLKTAFINAVHQRKQKNEAINKADFAASFRETVVSILSEKTCEAAGEKNITKIAVAGGVSANKRLRNTLHEVCRKRGWKLYVPSLSLCGDNAAMIGSAAYYRLRSGTIADLTLNAVPSLSLFDNMLDNAENQSIILPVK